MHIACPGVLGCSWDSVHGSLAQLAATTGARIPPGLRLTQLPRGVEWKFEPTHELQTGDWVNGGDIIGFVLENNWFEHRIAVPLHVNGRVASAPAAGKYTVDQTLMVVEDQTTSHLAHVTMVQRFPIRQNRPRDKDCLKRPMVTGIRAIDAGLGHPAPIGGRVAIIGGPGTGKTTICRALVAHSNHDVAVYVGCGIRGNEIVDLDNAIQRHTPWLSPKMAVQVMLGTKDPASLLRRFEGNWRVIQLILGRDPNHCAECASICKQPRTAFVSSRAGAPVFAHELAVYKGMCLAEYIRDMG